MSYIDIIDITKTQRGSNGQLIEVIKCFNLDIKKGEFVSIFGPNGCGKTTLLNIIADLIPSDSGSVRIGGRKPSECRIGFMFQNYAESLFPWLRNVDNIALSLDRRVGRKKKRQTVEQFVLELGLNELPLDKYPYQCSAGQQQLVALARELIYQPDLLLLDEPFVSLDYERRLSQQEYLLNTWARASTTVAFVSHEIDEAIYLADRVILLSRSPATVQMAFEIALPRPRSLEMLTSEAFYSIKTPILQAFWRIIGK